MKATSKHKEAWLLTKKKDGFAKPATEFSVVDELPNSVTTSKEPLAFDLLQAPASGVLAPLTTKLTPKLATLMDSPPPY